MNRVDKIIKSGLYLIMLLPLVFTSFTFFPWHYGKTMIFQILVEVLVALFLLAYFLCHPERSEGSLAFRRHLNLLDYSILLFLVIITITALSGVNPGSSFWGNQARANGVFTWWHFGAFYFLLVWFFKNCRERPCAVPPKIDFGTGQARSLPSALGSVSPPTRGGLRGGLLILAVLVAVIASLTALFPNLLPGSWRAASGGGLIGNRAFLASCLVLAIGISLYLFANFFCHSPIQSGNPAIYRNKCRWLFLVAPVLFLYTILDTGNRGALLGIIAGIFLGLALCLFLVRNRKVKIFSAVSLIVLCSLFFVLFLFRQSLFLQRHFPAAVSLANISLSSGTSETRLMAWQSGWQGFKEKPALGWGWGNYGVVFDKYYNPQFLKHSFAETVWDKPHNWLLEIGVTAGIFGMISYLAILFFAFYYLLKKNIVAVETHCNASLQRCGKIILFASLVAYFIAGLFLFETTNSLILWFAILAMISSSAVEANGRSSLQLGNGRSFLSKTAKKIVPCSLFLVLCFSLYLFHYLPLKSSYDMRQAELSTALMDWTEFADQALAVKIPFLSENAVFLAEQFTKFDKAGAIAKEKKIEDTALKITGVLEKASSKYPDNLSFPVWAGQVYLALGEKMDKEYYQPAEENLLKAERISPQKQEVLFLLGRLYLLKKDFGKALDFQKKAVAVAPEINISHWFLGLTYAAQGERARGLEEIEKAIELGYNLTIDQKLYVLDLYALEKNYSRLIEEYKKLIDEEPENVNWYIKLAAVYAEAGDKKEALILARQIAEMAPAIKKEVEEFIKKYKLDED